MFPNTALNSISPDVRTMQAFPNIFFFIALPHVHLLPVRQLLSSVRESRVRSNPYSRLRRPDFLRCRDDQLRGNHRGITGRINARNCRSSKWVLLTCGGKPQHLSEDNLVMMHRHPGQHP
jgi:hypothetical protein